MAVLGLDDVGSSKCVGVPLSLVVVGVAVEWVFDKTSVRRGSTRTIRRRVGLGVERALIVALGWIAVRPADRGKLVTDEGAGLCIAQTSSPLRLHVRDPVAAGICPGHCGPNLVGTVVTAAVFRLGTGW